MAFSSGQLPQLLFTSHLFQALENAELPPVYQHLSLVLGAQTWMQFLIQSGYSLIIAEKKGTIASFKLLALSANTSQDAAGLLSAGAHS